MQRVSTTHVLEKRPVPADAGGSRAAPLLPWSWPEGTRVLLAAVAIAAAISLAAGRAGQPRAGQRTRVASDLVLDMNTASPQALAALPHVGPTLARRIAEARADGPFRSPEDLRARVRGIGPATLAQIAPYVRIEAGTTITPELRPQTIAIVDAAASPGDSSQRLPRSRKPPRTRTRKAKGSLVALTAKDGAESSP